jgi:hypothetical protein
MFYNHVLCCNCNGHSFFSTSEALTLNPNRYSYLEAESEQTNQRKQKNGYGYSPSCVKKEVLRAASKLFLRNVLDTMIVEDDLLREEEEEEEEDLSFIYETLQSPNFVAELE